MPTDDITRVAVGDVELAALTSPSIDDRDRPFVLCLHGFPDSASTWRHLLPVLDDAGFRVAAPYLRGDAPSAVPADGCAQSGAASADAIALHEHFGGDDRAVIIGHDWGAPIAFGAAVFEPERWSRVVGMAVPPGGAMGAAFIGNRDQLVHVLLPERARRPRRAPRHLAFIDMSWADWSPGHDASGDLPAAKAAIREPENLAAALGCYRAALSGVGQRPDLEAVQQAAQSPPPQPTLYLHGTTDGGIGVEVAESARPMVGTNISIEILDGLGHFLHLEAPELVNRRILEFLT